jgi:hypothetical protein
MRRGGVKSLLLVLRCAIRDEPKTSGSKPLSEQRIDESHTSESFSRSHFQVTALSVRVET